MHDFAPATRLLSGLVAGVRDGQLDAPTPCEQYRLGDVLDHVDGLSEAFAAAARKDTGQLTGPPPPGDGGRLGPDWRTRIPARLGALAEAWRDPAAWQGMTRAGGVDLPGEFCGIVAIGEVVLHGWDVARASGQPFDLDEQSLHACLAYVQGIRDAGLGDGPDSPFGPAVEVPDDAPLLDRVVALSGRDPRWSPS